MTSSRNELSRVEDLLSELLAEREKTSGRKAREILKAGEEVKELANLDYAGPLRKILSKDQLDDIIKDARKTVWPHLNRAPLRLGSTKEFSDLFSGAGVEVRPAKMGTSTGLALMGFYVRKTKILSGRPLICVNTAHHPAAVGAAFVHEMGHHLTSEIFGTDEESASFLLYTGYAEHLNEPSELVADVLVSLGIYPHAMARKMFAKSDRRKTATRTDSAGNGQATVLEYLAKQYGLNFDGKLSVSQKFQYLAGSLHYTRLREALCNEFDR